jgi:hypothetical protein
MGYYHWQSVSLSSTLHTNIDAQTYKSSHFEVDDLCFSDQGVKFETLVEDFYTKVPGVTIDFSLLWQQSINTLLQ